MIYLGLLAGTWRIVENLQRKLISSFQITALPWVYTRRSTLSKTVLESSWVLKERILGRRVFR